MKPLKIQIKDIRISFSTCVNRIDTESRKGDPQIYGCITVQLKEKFRRIEDIQKKIRHNFQQIEGPEKEYKEDFIAAKDHRD